VFDDDAVNVGLDKANTSDGFFFGSPVHYADFWLHKIIFNRCFYSGSDVFAYKPGAASSAAAEAALPLHLNS